jgi:NADP-dependent 3-hydroxy acid dehydrogenase YdfG
VTQALLERGWRVVGTSRTIRSSKDLKPSPDLVLVDGDVSKRETALKVVDAALKHFGRIDLLVNNAGVFVPKAFTKYTEEDYNLVMNTNVAGFFYMTQQVIPQMKKQNSEHVVSIAGASVNQPSSAEQRHVRNRRKHPSGGRDPCRPVKKNSSAGAISCHGRSADPGRRPNQQSTCALVRFPLLK